MFVYFFFFFFSFFFFFVIGLLGEAGEVSVVLSWLPVLLDPTGPRRTASQLVDAGEDVDPLGVSSELASSG